MGTRVMVGRGRGCGRVDGFGWGGVRLGVGCDDGEVGVWIRW